MDTDIVSPNKPPESLSEQKKEIEVKEEFLPNERQGIMSPSPSKRRQYWEIFKDRFERRFTLSELSEEWQLGRSTINKILAWCCLQDEVNTDAIKQLTIRNLEYEQEGLDEIASLLRNSIQTKDIKDKDKLKAFIKLKSEKRQLEKLKNQAQGFIGGDLKDGAGQAQQTKIIINMPEIAKARHSDNGAPVEVKVCEK